MNLLYVLLVLLVVSRLFAEIAARLKQAPLVGELVAGVTIGFLAHNFSDQLPVISNLKSNEIFKAVSDLGIFFLMLLAGINLRPQEMVEASGKALAVAMGGMLVPLAAGFGLAVVFIPGSEVWLAQSFFLAVALAITAVPVAVRTLMDLGKLGTPFGRLIVSAAVIDDVASLVLLSILTAVIKSGAPPDAASFLLILGKLAVFFTVTILIGQFVFPAIGRWLQRAFVEQFELSMLLISALAYSVLAEALGMHFILGAFLAGLFFGRRAVLAEVHDRVVHQVEGITSGFLAPVFFAGIGLHLTGSALVETPVFVIVLILAAMLSKLIGAGAAARLVGISPRDSLGVGIAMSSRGAVELIIADIALRAGLFAQPDPTPQIVSNLFSSVVTMAIATTILAPIVLRWVFSQYNSD